MTEPQVTALLETPSSLSIRTFSLTVEAGSHPADFVSRGDEVTIGSADGNDLVLGDKSVLRAHCSISATKEGYLLRDLGSTNGTTIAGVRVQAGYLAPGCIIGVGQTRIRFEPRVESVEAPISRELRLGQMVGLSSAMRRVFALVKRVAATDATVLIEGETGTGKELVAEAIHELGARRDGPLIVLDCSAIPAPLVESELFGHEKGAFTGAHAARAGAFESADGGTIFLDEIGELPLDLQPKLLRALESRTVRPVGSMKSVPFNARVIAATNRDLRREVNAGRFRADVFYRLNVLKMTLPPLRERREDIPLLVAHFWEQFGATDAPPSDLVAAFAAKDWQGNIRELRSAVERALIFGDDALTELGNGPDSRVPRSDAQGNALGDAMDLSVPFRVAKERAVAAWERRYVALILEKFGTAARAAREVKMDRHHLGELLRRHRVR